MEAVDVSQQFTATSHAVPSPTASHLAFLSHGRLQIRSLTSFDLIRNIPLPSSHNLRHTRIAWSPPVLASLSRRPSSSSVSTPPRRSSPPPQPRSNRLLVTDDDTTRVYDLRDEKWSAVVSNGSGGMGKVAHVEFGATEDDVLVWSEFCAAVKAWCLRSGRSVEIRDPKFVGRHGRGWGLRPWDTRGAREGRGRVMALLCRSAGLDILMILAPRTYAVVNRVELPTADAAGLKWSRDGRWLGIWDTASSGYKLYIYTADGHLYRTITREPAADSDVEANEQHTIEGLGIKSVEWVPGNTYLAIGGWDKRVRILSARTFAPVVFLDHTPTIHVPSAPVYTEAVDAQGTRTYSLTPQPTTPPKVALEKNESPLMKQGISLLAFNADGTLCATRDDASPATVWIWNLRSLSPSMICIHFAPVRQLLWHPQDPSRLLIQTAPEVPVVYLLTLAPVGLACPSAAASTCAAEENGNRNAGSSMSLTPQPPAILTLAPHLAKAQASSSTWPATATATSTSSTPSPPPKHTLHWLTPPTTTPSSPLSFLLSHTHAHIITWPAGNHKPDLTPTTDCKTQIHTSIQSHHPETPTDPHINPKVHADSDSDDSLYEILTGRKARGLGESGLDEMF
ncbi:hypothetical protein IAQ61_005323 [Plenodomus lingam]|uniref:uncharacterized protein n=1 Tax=Leptosphaeria maculans TaxID=5022 RepID=UPI0033256513|nr:hypothetical protein IAQ61_005323 [Plenodomus lingam]